LSKYQDFQSYRLELLQRKAELENRQEYFKNLDYLQAELKKYEPELVKINSSLPSDPLAPALLDFFQKTASQNGLVFERIEFNQTSLVSERPYLLKQGIAIIINSPYPAFRKFILDIEKSSRLIQIESLSFALPEKGDVFTFNLIASINFLPEINEVNALETEATFQEF